MDIQKEREAFSTWGATHPDNPDITAYEEGIMFDAWLAAKAQAVPECTWTQNEDGYFDTSCGQSFVFSEPDDTPSSHEFAHCCFCGGQLIEAKEKK